MSCENKEGNVYAIYCTVYELYLQNGPSHDKASLPPNSYCIVTLFVSMWLFILLVLC